MRQRGPTQWTWRAFCETRPAEGARRPPLVQRGTCAPQARHVGAAAQTLGQRWYPKPTRDRCMWCRCEAQVGEAPESKELPQPQQVIQDVCTICYFLYPKGGADDQWASVKLKLLGDMQLLSNLKEYSVSNTKSDAANRAKKKLAALEKEMECSGSELQQLINSKNKATGGLF